MGLKTWTEDEEKFLKNNYKTKTYKEIGEALGKTRKSVQGKLCRMGLSLSKEEKSKRFSEACNKMRKNHGDFKGENNPRWKNGISKNHYHYKKIQKERYPEKVKAREKVSKALKSGKIEKKPCKKCGYDKEVFAHHKDYSKPLDIEWLCRKCHRKEHGDLH
jgi:hypothetical protein